LEFGSTGIFEFLFFGSTLNFVFYRAEANLFCHLELSQISAHFQLGLFCPVLGLQEGLHLGKAEEAVIHHRLGQLVAASLDRPRVFNVFFIPERMG
jgi:hypothetical protein